MNLSSMTATAFKVLTVALMFSLASCDSPIFDPVEGGGGTGGEKPPVKDCSVTGTMVRQTCGVSIYQGLWIRTDDGKLLQPCDQSFVTRCPFDFEEGDRVKFSYRKLTNGSPCDKMVTCLIALPPHHAVVIDCIAEIPRNNNCAPLVIKQHPTDEYTGVNILEARIEGKSLKLKVGYSGCGIQPADRFSLEWSGDVQESQPLQTRLYLVHSNPEMCLAYFTQELCFDVSTIKAKYPQPVILKLQDNKEVVF